MSYFFQLFLEVGIFHIPVFFQNMKGSFRTKDGHEVQPTGEYPCGTDPRNVPHGKWFVNT